jgi:hypothetical protein
MGQQTLGLHATAEYHASNFDDDFTRELNAMPSSLHKTAEHDGDHLDEVVIVTMYAVNECAVRCIINASHGAA